MSFEENGISGSAQDIHRAIVSLREELDAIDSYNQRAEMCNDESLKDILIHNRDEEVEHAVMLFESLRRTMPEFDECMKLYLFTEAPVTEVEKIATSGNADFSNPNADDSLKIGALRK